METPNLSLIIKSLFWDTDINKIDWDKQYKAVIQRVFERGNKMDRKVFMEMLRLPKSY